MKTDEHKIQASIVAYLDRVLPPYVRAVAVSNKPRSAIQGAMEKARGARKGFPDLLLIREQGLCGAIEVKAEGGKLSPEQKEWRDWFARNAVPYAVVRSIDDVQQTLAEWQVKTKAAA